MIRIIYCQKMSFLNWQHISHWVRNTKVKYKASLTGRSKLFWKYVFEWNGPEPFIFKILKNIFTKIYVGLHFMPIRDTKLHENNKLDLSEETIFYHHGVQGSLKGSPIEGGWCKRRTQKGPVPFCCGVKTGHLQVRLDM